MNTTKKHATGVAGRAIGNNYLLFGISFGLAGPFMYPLGLRGMGCHIFGDSSSGKTSVLEAAASVWGHGHNFLCTWNLTANGMETVCAEHTDTLLALDEISEVDPRDLNRVAYSVINGQGKIRSDRSGQARAPMLWRVALLSTGEHSVRARLAEAGITIKTGQELRLVDLPVTGEKFGIFSNLHGASDGAEFANQLRTAASQSYGHAGPMIVRAIMERDWADLRDRHQKIITCFSASNTQEARVAEMFAAVALAGEIAVHAGIVPWTAATSKDFSDSDSVNATVVLFNRWKENRETTTSFGSEHGKILGTILDAFEKHNDSRFSDLNATGHVTRSGAVTDPPAIRDRLGWWDDSNGDRIYLVLPNGLREITKGYDLRRVVTALEQAGAFTKKGSDKTSVPTRVNNQLVRLFYIDPAKLE